MTNDETYEGAVAFITQETPRYLEQGSVNLEKNHYLLVQGFASLSCRERQIQQDYEGHPYFESCADILQLLK